MYNINDPNSIPLNYQKDPIIIIIKELLYIYLQIYREVVSRSKT